METYYLNFQKKVIYNFRQNDLLQGGEGAPLSPIFHQIIVKEKKLIYQFVF